jgi:probable rRNA maturation factor
MGVDDFQLSILIISNEEITKLNKQYFDKDNPTDVIAFPMQKGEFTNINPNLLGDVVISAERAKEQASNLRHSTDNELDILVVHGILHLLGFEDDTPEKKKLMFDKTDEIIENISTVS